MTKYTPGDLENHDAIGMVIQDDHGRILMFYHAKFQFWTIPVGKAEPHQTPYQGMCTEVFEECGITVTAATELKVRQYVYVRQGKPVSVNLHLYQVDVYEGTLQNLEPHKHPEMRFMTREQIKAEPELSDATLLLLELDPELESPQ